MRSENGMKIHTRGGGTEVEEPFEKPVVLPADEDVDPARHAWADARFATDIMSEHGLFFALLMPPEVANTERRRRSASRPTSPTFTNGSPKRRCPIEETSNASHRRSSRR